MLNCYGKENLGINTDYGGTTYFSRPEKGYSLSRIRSALGSIGRPLQSYFNESYDSPKDAKEFKELNNVLYQLVEKLKGIKRK